MVKKSMVNASLGVTGGAMAPPDFGRSGNPISTKGGRLGTPRFSDLRTALSGIGILQEWWPEFWSEEQIDSGKDCIIDLYNVKPSSQRITWNSKRNDWKILEKSENFWIFQSCFGNNILTHFLPELGSAAGPVIQANGRQTFGDGLRSGGLLCFTTQWASVHTVLANSMVTLGKPGVG